MPEPRPIRTSLAALGRQLGLDPPGRLEQIEQNWETLAGRLAVASRPVVVKDDGLVVETSDPAVAEALRWSATAILEAVGGVLGETPPGRIEVRIRPARSTGDGASRW